VRAENQLSIDTGTMDDKSKTPLKDAASLIHTLDQAYADMNSQAANAARDAQEARKNARAASEIARRYLHRSYPSSNESPFGAKNYGGDALSTDAILMTSSSTSKNNNADTAQQSPTHTDTQPNSSPQQPVDTKNSSAATPHQVTQSQSESNTTGTASRQRGSRRMFAAASPSSSTERLAQSHADDVLEWTLQVERGKQALLREQRLHDETKAKVITAQAKLSSLEETIQQLRQALEQEKADRKADVEKMQQDLEQANYRADAADEDAEFALQLAKESAEARNQIEVELYQVKQELARSNYGSGDGTEQFNDPDSRRLVRFADEGQVADGPAPQTPRPSPPPAMVASGRLLLRRSLGKKYAGEGEDPDTSVILELERTPSKSAERRRKLREQLKELDEHDISIPTPPRPPPPPPPPKGFTSTFNAKSLEECAHILRTSGHRLELGGHWFRDGKENTGEDDSNSPTKVFHNLEAMTRQYCQSVEFKLERQQKEVEELSSLCGFLEQKLVDEQVRPSMSMVVPYHTYGILQTQYHTLTYLLAHRQLR
jgi:hypothetical protein